MVGQPGPFVRIQLEFCCCFNHGENLGVCSWLRYFHSLERRFDIHSITELDLEGLAS